MPLPYSGHRPYQSALQDLAHRIGMADKIIFTGEVADDDLVAHYALGDVSLMPNRTLANGDTEGSGLVFPKRTPVDLPVMRDVTVAATCGPG
jgi:phosphatidylinositol alpha-1,6-mannosyltransferase